MLPLLHPVCHDSPVSWVPSHSPSRLRGFRVLLIRYAQSSHDLPSLLSLQYVNERYGSVPNTRCLSLSHVGRTYQDKCDSSSIRLSERNSSSPPDEDLTWLLGYNLTELAGATEARLAGCPVFHSFSSILLVMFVKWVLLRAFLGVHPGLHAVAALSIPSCRVACRRPTTQATMWIMAGWLFRRLRAAKYPKPWYRRLKVKCGVKQSDVIKVRSCLARLSDHARDESTAPGVLDVYSRRY